MMAWGVLLGHALWICGLGIGLAALSIAHYQAASRGVGLQEALSAPGFLAAGYLAGILGCLGLFLVASLVWARLVTAGLILAAVWTLAPRLQREARRRFDHPHRRLADLLGRGLVGAGLLILMGWSMMTVIQTTDRARSLAAQFEQVRALTQVGITSLQSSDLERAGQHLSTMQEDLAVIDARIGPLLPLGRFLSWLPRYGGDLAAAADLLELGLTVTAAGDRTFQALSPALVLLDDTGGESGSALQLGEELLPILAAARPQLEVARAELQTVAQIRSRVDPVDLSPRVARLLEMLDDYQPWFETAVDGALLTPGLLGAEAARTYLLVAQNNHELRATGGFVSGVGEIRVVRGQIISMGFRDSYAVDNFEVPHEAAPPDLQATLSGQMWLFRDGNWEPDFSASARRMLDIYARDQGVSADGLIAVDLEGLELLVGALGPLTVEGISQPVTGGNVQQILQEQWAAPPSGPALGDGWDPEWWAHRKDFMGEVAAALLQKMQGGKGMKLGPLAGALRQPLEEKHLLLYLADAEAAALLRGRNWDGALPGGGLPSDFLMVVDSNVGFNKVDPNVTRSIQYKADLTNTRGPKATLTLSYRNRSSRPVEVCIQEARYGGSYKEMMDRCYWDYVRVYVPSGSRLLAGPDLEVPAGSLLARTGESVMPPVAGELSPNGLAVWRAFFDLAPGQEQVLTFEYALPVSVLVQRAGGVIDYRLLVQKQPGTTVIPLELELSLPVDAKLLRTLPADVAVRSMTDAGQVQKLLLSTDLRVDRQVEVSFRWGDNHNQTTPTP